jgi:Bor protein
MRSTRGRTLLLAAFVSGAIGCYKATFVRDPQAIRGIEQDRWNNFFIFGLVGEHDFHVREFCHDGRVAQIQTGGNFGTGLVSLLTIGIYTPRKVWVTCAAPGGTAPSSRLEIDADAQGRPVAAAIHRSDGAPLAGIITPDAQPGAWRVSFAESLP